MPSVVHFADENVGVLVDEDVEEVMEAWRAARGLPFALSYFKGGKAYVNPNNICMVLPKH